MNRNFEIVDGIYLVQESHELDLHNNFDFKGLDYSVEERFLALRWRRSNGDWVSSGTPKALTVEFKGVSEFRLRSIKKLSLIGSPQLILCLVQFWLFRRRVRMPTSWSNKRVLSD